MILLFNRILHLFHPICSRSDGFYSENLYHLVRIATSKHNFILQPKQIAHLGVSLTVWCMRLGVFISEVGCAKRATASTQPASHSWVPNERVNDAAQIESASAVLSSALKVKLESHAHSHTT